MHDTYFSVESKVTWRVRSCVRAYVIHACHGPSKTITKRSKND